MRGEDKNHISATMTLTKLINLHRVEVLGETGDEYNVRYGDEEYIIEKDEKTEWASASPVEGARLAQRLEQRLVPESGVFQDEEVPAAFKEVMMFHEIREKWYVEAKGLETGLAHELTLNDEVLYVLKFFDKKEARAYLTFAEKYREERQHHHKEEDDESEYANLFPVYALLKRIEKGKATPDQQQEFYFLVLAEQHTEYDKMISVIEETGQKPTGKTLARVCARLFDRASMDSYAAGWVLHSLSFIKQEFGYSPSEEEIRARYDEYAALCVKEPTAFLCLYRATSIPPTLGQIRIRRTSTRREYREHISIIRSVHGNIQDVTNLKSDRDTYLAELDQFAAEIRERKKEK